MQDALSSLDSLRPVVREIAEPLRLHLPLTRAERVRQVLRLLTDVGVPEPEFRAGQYPHELSGGLRQRALIASAIACGPELLSPTSRRRRSTPPPARRSSSCSAPATGPPLGPAPRTGAVTPSPRSHRGSRATAPDITRVHAVPMSCAAGDPRRGRGPQHCEVAVAELPDSSRDARFIRGDERGPCDAS
jgi:hypothetical protein